jgi:hypothetical protein
MLNGKLRPTHLLREAETTHSQLLIYLYRPCTPVIFSSSFHFSCVLSLAALHPSFVNWIKDISYPQYAVTATAKTLSIFLL